VDDLGSRLVILLLGDPHLLEGGQGGQDGASDPDGVLALRGSHDLDLHGGGGQGLDFLLHAGVNSLEHGGAPRQDDVSVQVLADIDVALHDGVISGGVNTIAFLSDQGGLEQHLTKLLQLYPLHKLKSIFGGQFQVQIHHTLAWRSTFVEM